jgi:hypothetical protein
MGVNFGLVSKREVGIDEAMIESFGNIGQL